MAVILQARITAKCISVLLLFDGALLFRLKINHCRRTEVKPDPFDNISREETDRVSAPAGSLQSEENAGSVESRPEQRHRGRALFRDQFYS